MSDSTRKPPDRLHLSGHPKLTFEDSSFSDIFGKHIKTRDTLMFPFHLSASTADGDRCPVPTFQFHLNILELACVIQQILEAAEVRRVSEYICGKAGIEQLV